MFKDMTQEMIEIERTRKRLEARASALKSRVFVRARTIEKAIIAEENARNMLWRLVTKTWPDTKGMYAEARRDDTIKFKIEE